MYRKNHSPHEAPLVKEGEHGEKIKNPNKITIDQHVIPQRHLEEWLDSRKLLTVVDKETQKSFTPSAKDAFYVLRLWDQAMETGAIRSTEKNYQDQIDIFKETGALSRHILVTEYFVMLAARAHCAAKSRPDSSSIFEPTPALSSQEDLELEEVSQVNSTVRFVRDFGDGQYLARLVVSQALNMIFIQGRERLKDIIWMPYVSSEGGFILPDSLWHLYESNLSIFPVSPNLVFVEEGLYKKLNETGRLTVEELNSLFLLSARRHFVSPPDQLAP